MEHPRESVVENKRGGEGVNVGGRWSGFEIISNAQGKHRACVRVCLCVCACVFVCVCKWLSFCAHACMHALTTFDLPDVFH